MARGTSSSQEEINALRQVAAFFEAHGAARFERIARNEASNDVGEDNATRSDPYALIRDRCGYREERDGTIYYMTTEAWRTEVCADLDPVFVARLLRDRGALDCDQGRLSKNVRLPETTRPTRVYAVRPDRIGDLN